MTGTASYGSRVVALVRAEWKTVPNGITAFRAVLSVVVLALMLNHSNAAPWLYAFTASTDWVDGWYARSQGQETFLGKILDPLVDKFLILLASIGLFIKFWGVDWFVIGAIALILVREVAVAVLVDVYRRKELTLSVTWEGKVKTAFQGVAFFALMLHSSGVAVNQGMCDALIVVVTVTVISGADYFMRAREMSCPVPDEAIDE